MRSIGFVLMALMTALLAVLLGSYSHASMSDCVDATCRITSPDGSRGTGCCFEISQGQVYILTAAHVVSKPNAVCEFWSQGHISSPLPAQLVARAEVIDSAILAVPVPAFGGRVPKVIPIADGSLRLQPGQTITSVGCAHGSWETAWRGHVLGYAGSDLAFAPPPADGRSGSALFDADGTKIVGVIRARTMDDKTGIATSLQALRSGMATQTQCGPSGCPSGGCPQAGIFQRQRQSAPGPQTPWPTLPQASPTPAPVDLSAITNLLDSIAGEVKGLRQPASPPIPVPSGPDPQVLQALDQHGQAIAAQGKAIQAIGEAVPKQIESAVTPLGKRLEEVANTTLLERRLLDKLRTDAEEGGLRGRIAERIVAKAEDDPSGLRHELLVGCIVVGLIGLVTFCVLHLKKNGSGPIHDLVAKLAEKNPDNEKLQALHGKLDSIDQRILTRMGALESKVDAQSMASILGTVQQAASQAATVTAQPTVPATPVV